MIFRYIDDKISACELITIGQLTLRYDAIILAVAHNEFKKLTSEQIRNFGKENHVIYDIKYLLNLEDVDGRL